MSYHSKDKVISLIRKSFNIINNKYINLKRRLIFSRKVKRLQNKEILRTSKLKYIWNFSTSPISDYKTNFVESEELLGCKIDYTNINWFQDYCSGTIFQKKRFDKINLRKYTNIGADVNFPWQLSCGHYLVKLGQEYRKTKNANNYIQFKDIVSDWIEKNKFLYGINWFCGMEVGIRAVNWVVAYNLFYPITKKDHKFNKLFLDSLIQHAEYLSAFPEVSENGYTNNHATASFTGLLFLAVTLKTHPCHSKWLSEALNGLIDCMKYQVYNDGVNFEGSIYYNRLVLELFSFSTILCLSNGIVLPTGFIKILFKMFEYTAAYLDHHGNAPQVGDNDSSRLIIFEMCKVSDHSYLLDIGEHIFDYHFDSACTKRNPVIKISVPQIKKIKLQDYNIEPRKVYPSFQFENGGATVLSNRRFHAFISYFPLGQNGKGGHNHIDVGSFTLSINGKQIIGDPGSFSYNRSKSERDIYRSPNMHNIMIYKTEEFDLTKIRAFSMNKFLYKEKSSFNKIKNEVKVIIKKEGENLPRKRLFTVDNDHFTIKNYGEGNNEYHFYLIIHPDSKAIKRNDKIIINGNIQLSFENVLRFEFDNILYSTSYNVVKQTNRISFTGNGKSSVTFKLLNNK